MLPFFYQPDMSADPGQEILLDEATSKHCIQVLRMSRGARLTLTNGRGLRAEATITEANRKKCAVMLNGVTQIAPRAVQLSLALAFTKSKSRNEWLLEKACELGIDDIYPVVSRRSEKEKYNANRYELILIAALIQSQQTWLPRLHAPVRFADFLTTTADQFSGQKFMAHCLDHDRQSFAASLSSHQSCMALIGPEGDFTEDEIDAGRAHGFEAVHLGPNRLRTETAALYCCTLFNAFHYG